MESPQSHGWQHATHTRLLQNSPAHPGIRQQSVDKHSLVQRVQHDDINGSHTKQTIGVTGNNLLHLASECLAQLQLIVPINMKSNHPINCLQRLQGVSLVTLTLGIDKIVNKSLNFVFMKRT